MFIIPDTDKDQGVRFLFKKEFIFLDLEVVDAVDILIFQIFSHFLTNACGRRLPLCSAATGVVVEPVLFPSLHP